MSESGSAWWALTLIAPSIVTANPSLTPSPPGVMGMAAREMIKGMTVK